MSLMSYGVNKKILAHISPRQINFGIALEGLVRCSVIGNSAFNRLSFLSYDASLLIGGKIIITIFFSITCSVQKMAHLVHFVINGLVGLVYASLNK